MRDRIGQPATILGPGLLLKGDLEGSGHFLVAGHVTGNADIEGALTLAADGRWQGRVRADDVVLAGHFEGEVHARGRIEITATGRVNGRVVGGDISIAQGAVVEAELQVLSERPVHKFEDRRGG